MPWGRGHLKSQGQMAVPASKRILKEGFAEGAIWSGSCMVGGVSCAEMCADNTFLKTAPATSLWWKKSLLGLSWVPGDARCGHVRGQGVQSPGGEVQDRSGVPGASWSQICGLDFVLNVMKIF